MTASTCYHLFSAISAKVTETLLRIDLIGIGVMIFTLCLTCVFAGYHSQKLVRNNIMGLMIAIFAANVIAQSMPCYARPENDCIRTSVYVGIILLCLGLAISWYCFFASEEEEVRYTLPLFSSFVYLGIGFFFFHTGYPERLFPQSRFVQIYL